MRKSVVNVLGGWRWWCVCSGPTLVAHAHCQVIWLARRCTEVEGWSMQHSELVGIAIRVLQALLVLQLKQWIAQLGAHPRGLSISTAEAQTARSRHKAGLSAAQLQD